MRFVLLGGLYLLGCHYHPDHPIQTLFGLLPIRHYLPHEPVEAFAVVYARPDGRAMHSRGTISLEKQSLNIFM